MQLIEKTTNPRHPHWVVVGDHGLDVGTVTLTRLGRQGRVFYDARSSDGCDLGAHPKMDDAVDVVLDDARAGHPRSPRNPGERHRPLYDGPEPVYPQTAGSPGR